MCFVLLFSLCVLWYAVGCSLMLRLPAVRLVPFPALSPTIQPQATGPQVAAALSERAVSALCSLHSPDRWRISCRTAGSLTIGGGSGQQLLTEVSEQGADVDTGVGLHWVQDMHKSHPYMLPSEIQALHTLFMSFATPDAVGVRVIGMDSVKHVSAQATATARLLVR